MLKVNCILKRLSSKKFGFSCLQQNNVKMKNESISNQLKHFVSVESVLKQDFFTPLPGTTQTNCIMYHYQLKMQKKKNCITFGHQSDFCFLSSLYHFWEPFGFFCIIFVSLLETSQIFFVSFF